MVSYNLVKSLTTQLGVNYCDKMRLIFFVIKHTEIVGYWNHSTRWLTLPYSDETSEKHTAWNVVLKEEMQGARATTTKNGKMFTQGMYPVFGTYMFWIGRD